MLLDKFCHMPILRKTPWFALFGLINGACYGLSYMMSEEDYVYYFGYKGEGRYSDLIRAQVGSNTLTNAMWTAPALIVGGMYMHKQVGYMTMGKFTLMSLLGIAAFQTAFNPSNHYTFLPNVRVFNDKTFGVKFDSMGYHPKLGCYFMGADNMAMSLIYFAAFYHRMWALGLGFALFDTLYYGPQFAGAPLSAMIGAMTLL